MCSGYSVVKSGTDFRDLSEISLELEETPDGSIRRKIIKRMSGSAFFILSIVLPTIQDITQGRDIRSLHRWIHLLA